MAKIARITLKRYLGGRPVSNRFVRSDPKRRLGYFKYCAKGVITPEETLTAVVDTYEEVGIEQQVNADPEEVRSWVRTLLETDRRTSLPVFVFGHITE